MEEFIPLTSKYKEQRVWHWRNNNNLEEQSIDLIDGAKTIG